MSRTLGNMTHEVLILLRVNLLTYAGFYIIIAIGVSFITR
jgi:hypothetical protein